MPGTVFPKPFKLTKYAGLLVLVIIIFIIWAIGFIICELWRVVWDLMSDHFGVDFDPGKPVRDLVGFAGMAVAYMLFMVYYTCRWKTYFRHLPDEESHNHCSRDPLPIESPERKTANLSMRPTKIALRGYLWCMHVVWPFFVVSVVFKLMYSWMVRRAYKFGLLQKADASKALAEFYLETTAGLGFFTEITDDDDDGHPMAHFTSSFFDPVQFPIVGGGMRQTKALETKIDLTSMEAVAVSLDGAPLSIEQGLLLLMHLYVWQCHAWLHALAMWGCDKSHQIPWVANMSTYSYFFNHLGGDGGIGVMAEAVHVDWDPMEFSQKAPMQRPLRPYDRLRDLLPYSRFGTFITLAHEIFMTLLSEPEFAKAFSGLDSEGHFIASVVHSLDHFEFQKIFGPPSKLLLCHWDGPNQASVTSTETGDIHYKLIGALCRMGFALSDDWPKLFNVYIRQAPHPFYQRFYAEVSKFDPELAWHMQGCMIK